MVADFGLANASIESQAFDGTRPYMAPEQWSKGELSHRTDVFALGVMLCELLSGGYHPNGIKLSEHWPQPIAWNSKKWTRPDPWEKWALGENSIKETLRSKVDADAIVLANKMLSSSVAERPSVSEVLEDLLSMIEKRCKDSHRNVRLLINHYSNLSCSDSLEKQWPYLHKKWLDFEARFG